MSHNSNIEFAILNVDAKNYKPWGTNAKMYLESRWFANTILENNESSSHDKAKANMFLHKHIDDVRKFEYLTTDDPSVLWKDLKNLFNYKNNRKFYL